MVELIGGILVDGTLRRDVALRPISGAAELALAEVGSAPVTQPEKVTAFLTETIAGIGGRELDRTLAADLSIGDRQYLVRQIGAHMGHDRIWLSGTCTDCAEAFDLAVDQSRLPAKPAGTGYPVAELEIDGVSIRLRAPTGADQTAIAGLPEEKAVATLLDRLVDRPEGVTLTPEAMARIEATIEDLAPEVALQASTTCPECGAANVVDVDPYLTLTIGGHDILAEIHVLARAYHWGETEILNLPRARRKTYLSLIDRERGMISHDAPGALH